MIIFGLISLLALHLFILVHLQFISWPEMFSYPYLLNNGFSLYKDIALPYQPLLMLILSVVYKIFGYSLLTLQLFAWSLILLSDLLIFLISKKILGFKISSLVPVLLMVLITPLASGNTLWFDLATIPFILLAFLSSFYKKFLFMGFFFASAFFIKQQTGLAILFLGIYFLLSRRFRDLFNFILGFLVLLLLTLTYIIYNGIFEDYLFWTIVVPLYWYPKLPGYANIPSPSQLITTILIFLPGVVLAIKDLKRSEENMKVIFISFLGLFLVAFPRFEYFRVQPAFAAFFILTAYVFKKEHIKIVLLPFLLAIVILVRGNIKTFNLPARFYGPEEMKQVKGINNETKPGDKIYLIGVPSIEYILTNHLPAKPWVDNYVWYMEIEGLQDKIIKGLDLEKPQVVFWKTPISGNWYDLGTYQPKMIVEYIKNNYQKTGNLNEDIEIWKIKD